MANALHDANNVPTMIGVQVDGTITQLKIDNATGYLLASIAAVSDVVPASVPINAVKDANGVSSMLGATAGGSRAAVLIDNRNGYVWATNS